MTATTHCNGDPPAPAPAPARNGNGGPPTPPTLTDLAATARKARQDADAQRAAEAAAEQHRHEVEARTRMVAAAHGLIVEVLGEVAGIDKLTWATPDTETADTTLDGLRLRVLAEYNFDFVCRPSLWLRLDCPAAHTDEDLQGHDGSLWRRIDPSHLVTGRKHEAREETLVQVGKLLAANGTDEVGCPACKAEAFAWLCERCYDRDRVAGGDLCEACLEAQAQERDADQAAGAEPALPTLAERLDGAEIGYPDETAALSIQHARRACKVQGTDREPDGEALIAALNGLTLALLSVGARYADQLDHAERIAELTGGEG